MNKLLAWLEKIPVFKLLIPLFIGLGLLFAVLIVQGDMQLLHPAGPIANLQSKILWGALIFAVVVGVGMLCSFFFVVLRYKEDSKGKYAPNWVANKTIQLVGWVVPLLAILAISVMIWVTAHQIDPYKPISSSETPVTIQVVALRWKWLFIYPNDHIATVNMLEIPVGIPINFELTADAPMNSFWVPRLGGQVYAMTGMATRLHLKADTAGTYPGSSAEISGDGYSGMNFTVKAVSRHEYGAWKAHLAQSSAQTLNWASYSALARPSSYNAPAFYRVTDSDLFNGIMMQYMTPGNDQPIRTGGS